jgi:hypothetical protein
LRVKAFYFTLRGSGKVEPGGNVLPTCRTP